jgi:hypothetical protein
LAEARQQLCEPVCFQRVDLGLPPRINFDPHQLARGEHGPAKATGFAFYSTFCSTALLTHTFAFCSAFCSTFLSGQPLLATGLPERQLTRRASS